MDSRIIYESSKTFGPKIKWTRKGNSKSEWLYFDLQNPEIIENIINDFFITDTLHISLGRHDSYTEDKNVVFSKIKPLIGKTDFKIWNEPFTKAIEVSTIGVYRTGYAAGDTLRP